MNSSFPIVSASMTSTVNWQSPAATLNRKVSPNMGFSVVSCVFVRAGWILVAPAGALSPSFTYGSLMPFASADSSPVHRITVTASDPPRRFIVARTSMRPAHALPPVRTQATPHICAEVPASAAAACRIHAIFMGFTARKGSQRHVPHARWVRHDIFRFNPPTSGRR